MALRNIITPANPQMNSRGEPVAGGFVYLYEPGTTTFITSYFGADLVTPHQNPVRLSGSGRADIWITLDCDMVITDRNGNTVLTQDNANPASLGGETSSLVPNGSFETVTTPPVPDGWSALNDAGSTNAVDSTESTDGANSYRFTSAGSGGGSLTTTDFFPVNAVDQLRVNFNLFSDVAAVRNIVRIEWYDVTFTPISDSDVYDSTANPATWTEFQLIATPPALARFAKCKLIGIDPSVLLAGNTYFDQIAVFYPTVVSGIFDNITIQDNEIISTNLNGEISLKPNGLGPVNIFSTGLVDLADVQNALNISSLLDPAVSPHIAFDQDQIQAKLDATNAGDLAIGVLGGFVSIGGGGFARIVTASANTHFRSNTNTDAEQRRILLTHQDGTVRAFFGNNGDSILDIRSQIDSGLVRLRGQNSGSLARNILEADPDGNVDIYNPLANAIGGQSRDPAAGGWFANNTLTGAGLERVLTTPGDAGVLLPVGTTTNSSLRWNGSAWVEELSVRILSGGGAQMDTLRSVGGAQISIVGMDENDVGLLLNDGAKITWNDLAFANPIELGNVGIGGGSGELKFSAAGSFSVSLWGGSFLLRPVGGGTGGTFSYTGTVLGISGGDTIKLNQSLMLTQANSPPTGQSSNNVLYQKNTQQDADIQPYIVPGVGGIEHALAYLNTKRISNTSHNMNTAQNAEEVVNGNFFYDDGASYTLTLEPNTTTRFPVGGAFTVLVPGSNVITVAVGATGNLFFIDPGTGTSDVGASCTIGTGGTSGYATIYRDTANDWFILGGGIVA